MTTPTTEIEVTCYLPEDHEPVDPAIVADHLRGQLARQHGGTWHVAVAGMKRRKTPGGRPILVIHGEAIPQ